MPVLRKQSVPQSLAQAIGLENRHPPEIISTEVVRGGFLGHHETRRCRSLMAWRTSGSNTVPPGPLQSQILP
jgi:hypothetical protein